MKTAQSIDFFIRQLRPSTRIHSLLPYAPGRIFVQHTKPLRPPTTALNTPYSSRTQIHDGLLAQKTPPGASFAPDKPLADTSSSPVQAPIIEAHDTKASTAKIKTQRPSYQIHFTCKPCGFRSAHEISKHGYHSGSILVTCPSCKNRHVISDHLKVSTSCPLYLGPSIFRANIKVPIIRGNEMETKLSPLIDHYNRYSPTSHLQSRTS